MKAKFSLLCMVFLFGSLTAFGAERVGVVVAIEGQATATGVGNVRALKLKSVIFANDKIVTKPRAKLQIMFDDDSLLAQGENSTLVMDKFVYDPKRKGESSFSVKMTKGLFRLITGKVAEMNPDQFKVRTRRAVIGIRGCEVGCETGMERDDWYIVRVPKAKQISIEALMPGVAVHERVMNVMMDGIMVSIRDRAGFRQRGMTPEEHRDLIDRSTPGAGKRSGLGGAFLGASGMNAFRDDIADTLELAATAAASSGGRDEPTRRIDDGRPLSGPFLSGPTAPPSPFDPAVAGPPTFPANFKTSDMGPNYVWAIWEKAGGYFMDMTPERLTQAQYVTWLGGLTVPHTLTGVAEKSGAVLRDGSGDVIVEGTSRVTVNVAASSTAWTGEFRLPNAKPASDSFLDFDASGFVIPSSEGGTFTGGFTDNGNYRMRINGTDHAFPTSDEVKGWFTGDPAGNITGAMGYFWSVCGSSARSDGCWGCGFPPPAP